MTEPVAESQGIWNRIAGWWDNMIGEGNDFQKTLIMPASDRLLNPGPGQVIADIACGNGNYSRRLGRAGASVVACDFCQTFLECARKRTSPEDGDIEYLQIDATDESQLLSLGKARFDSIVCSMAIMDMPVIDPLFSIVPHLLKPGGSFVFSLSHPCFNSNQSRLTAELINENGKIEQIYGVAIRTYLTPTTDLSTGIINQPEPHLFYHRPLHDIFASIFRAGLVIDGFEEPRDAIDSSKGKNPFSWAKRPDIPPAMVIRARSPLG